MKTKAVVLSVLAALSVIAMLAAPAAAAAREGEDPEPLRVKIGRDGWRTVDATLVSKASRTTPGQVLPFLIFDEHGQLNLSQLPVEGDGWLDLFKEGACNGGSCLSGGGSVDCPTSGGPTCTANQNCYCVCEGGGGTTSTHNECRDKPKGDDEILLD